VLTRGAVLLAALALVVSGAAASGSDATPIAGAHGIGDPYFPLDGNGGIDVRSYDVHDAYSFARRRLSGWTTVTLRTTEPLRSFDLDFLLPVRAVSRTVFVTRARNVTSSPGTSSSSGVSSPRSM
jgi:hypothetical protein